MLISLQIDYKIKSYKRRLSLNPIPLEPQEFVISKFDSNASIRTASRTKGALDEGYSTCKAKTIRLGLAYLFNFLNHFLFSYYNSIYKI